MRPRTTVDAQFFWANWPATPERLTAYLDTVDRPDRQAVLDALATIPDVTTVVELGCHCGPLLRRLVDAGYAASGVDANYAAVKVAQFNGLIAVVGTVPDVFARLDGPVDVIVTSYCLAYLAPEELDRTLRASLQIARRGLVFAEPMVDGRTVELAEDRGYVEWHHDVMAALFAAHAAVGQDRAITATRLPLASNTGMNGIVVAQWQ